MKPHWGQVLAVFAAVVVVGVVTVLLVANTEPGSGSRPTATSTPTKPGRTTSVPARPTPSPSPKIDSGCRIGKGTTQLAAVPAGTTDRVNKAWERIEKWLAAKAPKTAATLEPPAALDRIAETQRRIGVPLPPELIASLLRHDGAGTTAGTAAFTLPPFYQPNSATGIVTGAEIMCRVLGTEPIDETQALWWHGQVVPFAADGGGGHLLLDQRPGHNGRLGKHMEEDGMHFESSPRTLVELLEVTATSLETGAAALGRYRPAVVDGGELDWDIVR